MTTTPDTTALDAWLEEAVSILATRGGSGWTAALDSIQRGRAVLAEIENELQEALDALSQTPPHPATAASVLRGVLAREVAP